MGFFQLLDINELFVLPRRKDDPSRPVFLRFLTGNRLEAKGIHEFVSIVEDHLIPMNEVARGKLVGAIIEAINNTLDHAHPVRVEGETMPKRWWMSSWVNVVDHEVNVMLFDQGVGIPATLPPETYDRIKAAVRGIVRFQRLTTRPGDGEMIMAATELHRTSTGQDGRGKGFRNMKQFIDACNDGELRVLSNRGRYSYISGNESSADESRSIGGTVIEWRFRNVGSVDLEDD